jgi:hypothetical protein
LGIIALSFKAYNFDQPMQILCVGWIGAFQPNIVAIFWGVAKDTIQSTLALKLKAS